MAVPIERRLFTAEEYQRMAEAGILGEDDRVELIDGEILQMSPIGPRHAGCVKRLRLVFEGLGGSAVVGVQDPVRLGEYVEPEPDLSLLRPRADLYASSHPTASDVLLLIEVADTSIEYDRQVKAALYARHDIPELWIVDLGQQHIAVYRDPTPTGYRTVRVPRPGESISSAAFPDPAIAIADILR